MTLPASGIITMNNVNQELLKASPYQQIIGLNDTDVRSLFAKPSGNISLSDGYGKSSSPFTDISGGGSAYAEHATLSAYSSITFMPSGYIVYVIDPSSAPSSTSGVTAWSKTAGIGTPGNTAWLSRDYGPWNTLSFERLVAAAGSGPLDGPWSEVTTVRLSNSSSGSPVLATGQFTAYAVCWDY